MAIIFLLFKVTFLHQQSNRCLLFVRFNTVYLRVFSCICVVPVFTLYIVLLIYYCIKQTFFLFQVTLSFYLTKMITVNFHKRSIGLLFVFYLLPLTASVSDKDAQNLDGLHNVLKLLQDVWKEGVSTEEDVFDKDFYTNNIITTDKTKAKIIKEKVFEELKKEFDVASCIFWGVAQAANIEKAVIYLHTTKYVFTSLRYSLDLFSKKKTGIGKLERELAPFAIVLNSVLKYGKIKSKVKTTYSGETFMCDKVNGILLFSTIAFHTFMPSSEDFHVAIQYAEKKGDKSCLFFFRNEYDSIYSPSAIHTLSYEPKDKEVVYPIGAIFQKINCAMLEDSNYDNLPENGKERVFCLKLVAEDSNKYFIERRMSCDKK